jgi:hypothetical protein
MPTGLGRIDREREFAPVASHLLPVVSRSLQLTS